MDKTYRIAQFGTYDIESTGDTMFPKGFSYGIQRFLPVEIELFSMTECAAPYNGNSHVYSFDQFMERSSAKPFDAVVIGGGEFLHFKKIDVVIDGSPKSYPEGFIWKKPIDMAREARVPTILLNCVGVSYDFTPSQQQELREYMEQVDLISVRDEFSALRVRKAGIPKEKVVCVADNLWYFNRMYPKQELTALRCELEKRTGHDFCMPYLVVQYGTTKNTAELTRQLLTIKDRTGYRIYLMAVNYCHEDRTGLKQLKAAGGGAFLSIEDYFQPVEILSVIAGAKAFFGTSFHGNLISASYGVPFVGIDMYSSFVSKMDGLFMMLGCEQYLTADEFGVAAAYEAFAQDRETLRRLSERIEQIQTCLDGHFARMAKIIRKETE